MDFEYLKAMKEYIKNAPSTKLKKYYELKLEMHLATMEDKNGK
jgi:hypothetical protein